MPTMERVGIPDDGARRTSGAPWPGYEIAAWLPGSSITLIVVGRIPGTKGFVVLPRR